MAAAATIEFRCESCKQAYRVKTELAGKKIKCKCGHVMNVPRPAAKPAAPKAAPEIVDLNDDNTIGLSDHAAHMTAKCPSCGKALPPSVVLCVDCGFNLKTGQKLGAADPKAKPIKEKRLSSPGDFLTIARYAALALIGVALFGFLLSVMGGGYIGGFIMLALQVVAAVLVVKIAEQPPGSSAQRIGGYILNLLVAALFALVTLGTAILAFVDLEPHMGDLSPDQRRAVQQVLEDSPLTLHFIHALLVTLLAVFNLFAIMRIKRL